MNYFTFRFETPLTILLAVAAFVLVIYAQTKIQKVYSKYKNVKTKKILSGSEVARLILDNNGLDSIYVVEIKGNLTDHYDPKRKVIRLSTNVFHGESVAAMSIAAHEVGHAIQDNEGYLLFRVRSILVPFVNLVSYLGYFGIIISIFAGITGYLMVSILILCATLIFQLATLPVEFDASKRANQQIGELELADELETKGSQEMLKAAAMTYVASLASTVINIIRLIIMTQDRD